MAVNLGHLLLSFGVDTTAYDRSLDAAKVKALSCGKDIERAMSGLNLQLKPKVDDSALTALNQHLDLKQRHVEQLQRTFDSKPLKPKVDTQELDRLKKRLEDPLSLNINASAIDSLEDRVNGLDGRVVTIRAIWEGNEGPGGLGGVNTPKPTTASGVAFDYGLMARAVADGTAQGIARTRQGAVSRAVSAVATGFLEEGGRGLASGIGLSRGSVGAGRGIRSRAETFDREALGLEESAPAFFAELLRSGSMKKSVAAGFEQTPAAKAIQRLQSMQSLAMINREKPDVESLMSIPSIGEGVRSGILSDPKNQAELAGKSINEFFSTSRRGKIQLAALIEKEIADIGNLAPTEFIQQIINGVLGDAQGPLSFVSKMQGYRNLHEARQRAPGVQATLPDLQEGQDGYVQMIGGAMFREGEGHEQLTAGFDAMFPGRQVIGVRNPDTDPGAKVQGAVGQFVEKVIKGALPDLAKDPNLSNTVTNAITLVLNGLNPVGYSETVAQALANVIAAEAAGIDPSKFATVSYSAGGANAKAAAVAMQRAGISSPVQALAYPDINLSGAKLPNFKASMVEEDPLGFVAAIGLGNQGTTTAYEAGTARGLEAHAPKHYFKNENQVNDFYRHLGIQREQQGVDDGKFVDMGSNFYEVMGSTRQAESLLATGEFDPNLPFKAFAGGEVDGGRTVLKSLEALKTMARFRVQGKDGAPLSEADTRIRDKAFERFNPSQQAAIEVMVENATILLNELNERFGDDLDTISGGNRHDPTKIADGFQLRKFQTIYNDFVAAAKDETGVASSPYYTEDSSRALAVAKELETDKGWFKENLKGSDELPKIKKIIERMQSVLVEQGAGEGLRPETLDAMDPIRIPELSTEFETLLQKKMDPMKLPSKRREFKFAAPGWAYENQNSVVAYNKIAEGMRADGIDSKLPSIQGIGGAAYGMSGASALISDYVYKTDIHDPAKVASDNEVAAYQKMAGRYAPLLMAHKKGEYLVTEKAQGRSVKDELEGYAVPAREAQANLKDLQGRLTASKKEDPQGIVSGQTVELEALVKEEKAKLAAAKKAFNDQAETLYTKMGQLLATMHEMGVAHMDLAAGNAFVAEDGTISAIDLGNSISDPSPLDKNLDILTAQQRAVVDLSFMGILDPTRQASAVRGGYGKGALPKQSPRMPDLSAMADHEGEKVVPLGSETPSTFSEYGGQRYKVRAREIAQQRMERAQAAEMAEWAGVEEITETQAQWVASTIGSTAAPKTLSRNYRALGLAAQTDSLLTSGKLDPGMPLEYGADGETSGRKVLADFSTAYAAISKTKPMVSGLSEEDREAQLKARGKLDETYAKLKAEVMRTSGAHESMTPDDVAGFFSHQAALPDYREGVRSIEMGDGAEALNAFNAIQEQVAASIPDTGPYREKILGMLADVKAIAKELQETGSVSSDTMARAVERIAPVEFEGSREKGTSTIRHQTQEAAKALGWDFSVARDIGVQTVAIYNAEGRPIHEVGSMDQANDLMRKESARVKQMELQAQIALQSRDLEGRDYYLQQAERTRRGTPLGGWQTYEEPEGGNTGSRVDAMQGLYASPVDALLDASEVSPQRRLEMAQEREQKALELKSKISGPVGATSRAAGRLTRLAQDSGEAIKGVAESAIVARVNTQLARTPGEPNTIDLAPRQVESLGELGAKDLGKMAWLGITDAVKPAQQLYSTLLGIEDTFMRITGLGGVKGLLQASAAVGLATQIPGAAGAFSAASELATPLVSGGIEGALSFGGNAFLSGAGSVFGALPGSGAVAHALAPFANAAGPALAAGTGAVADATAAVATPVMLALGAGRVAKGTIDAAGRKLLPPGSEQRRLAAARRSEEVYDFVDAGIGQLQGYKTPQRMSLSSGFDGNTVDVFSGVVGAQRKAQEGLAIVRQNTKLASQQALVNPNEAGQLVELLGEDLAEIVQTIDVAFGSMSASERSSNTELAGIKGQLARLKQTLASIELGRPSVAPAVQENDRFLSRSGPAPARFVVNASARIRDMGNRFSQEAKTAERMAFNSQEQQEAAQQLLNAAAAAKLALEELLEEAGGKNAPQSVRKAVGAARGQITRASARATDIRGNASGAMVANDIVDGMSAGMAAKVEGVVDSAHAISKAFLGTIKDDFEIRSPSKVMVRIGHDIAEGLENGLDMLETLKEILPEYLGPVIDKAKEWGAELIEGFQSGAGERMKGLGGIATALTTAFAGFSVIALALPALSEFGAQSLEAAIQMERLERVINFSSGGAAKGGKALEFVRDEVKRLNTDLRSSIEGYAQLAANTKDTSLEGVATQQIFSGVSQANAAFSLAPEDSELVFLAINQMAQKSVVSMEELRQQLGERLPQTMKIAADSMGMTTSEFTKMVAEGRILAEDFLPKFGQELAAVTAGTAAEAANSTQGKINALNTAVLELQATAGEGLIPLKNLQLDISTKALELVEKHMDKIIGLAKFLAFAVGVNLALAWAKAGKAFLAYNGMSMIGGLNAMGAAIKANIALIGKLVLKLGLIYVAQKAIEGVVEIVNQNADSKRRSREAQSVADKATRAYLATSPEGIAAADAEARKRAAAGPQSARDIQTRNPFLQFADFSKRRLFTGLATSGEHRTNDLNRSISALITTANQTLGETAEILKSNAPAKLRGIDQQLATLQTQRRSLVLNDPQNEAGRTALLEQEGGLLEERKKLVDRISGNKGALKAQFAIAEAEMEALETRSAEGKIAPPDYDKETARLESTKARITSFVEKLNSAGKITGDTLSIMVMSLEDMAARIRDSIWAIDQAQIANETAIFEGQVAGEYRGGQADSLRAISAQNAAIEKLTQTMQLQQQIRGTLSLSENATALQAMGISPDVGPNEITKLRARYEDGSREGALLDQLGSLRELETETAEAQRSIAEARASLSSQLREMGKQIAEFVRGVAQQIEDGQLAIKEAGLQAKSAGFQARIRGVLGINEGFIGEYVDGIFELFELIQEPIRQAIEATRQQQGLTRGLADSARAMAELQGQMPGGTMQGATVGMGFAGGGGAGGGSFASGLKTGPAGAIGAGTEYHLDTKFPRSMPMSEIVSLFDEMAAGYREVGRVIEFSSDGIGGARYDETASAAEKAALLKSAFDAHWRQDATRFSTDYFIPERSDPKGRWGQSAVGAEVILPQIAGGRVEFDKEPGGYGSYANLYDAGGNLKMQTGHGDMRQALPQDRTFAATQRAQSAGPIAQGMGQGSLNLQQAMGLLQGGSNSFAAKAIGLPEGTRTAGGGWTTAGTVGHSDPGNRAANIGSFSAQGNLNRGSAEASDKAVIEKMLRPLIAEFMQVAQAKGVQVTPKLLMNYLDAHVQSPLAARTATSGTTFLGGLGMVKGRENDDAAILELRKAMYHSGGQRTIAGLAVEYNQNDRMQKLNKGMAAAGGGALAPAGGFGGLVAPTTGMTQASVGQMEANNQFAAAASSQLGGAQSALQANVQAQLNAAAQLSSVQAVLNAAQVEQKKKDIIRQGERTLADERRTTIEQSRQAEDIRLSTGPETVERVNLRTEIEAARSYADGVDQFEKRTRSLSEQIENTEKAFAELSRLQAEGGLPPQMLDVVAFLGESIPKLKVELKDTQVNAEAFNDANNARITQVQEEGRARLEERHQKQRQQTEGVNREIQGAQLAGLELFSPNDVGAIMDLRSEIEKLKISDTFMAQRSEMAELAKTEPEQAAKLVALYEKLALVNLGNVTEELRKQREEREAALDAAQRGARQAVTTSGNDILGAVADRRGAYGLDDDVVREQIATSQQGMDHENRLAAIDDLERMGEASGYTSEQLAILRDNAEHLNQVKLEGIRDQFDPLIDVAKGFGEEMKGALKGLITGTKTAGEAFRDFVGGMASRLADLALNGLFNQIFGGMLGGLGGKGGGVGGGGIVSIIGGLIPGAKDGGMLMDGDFIFNYKTGKAMGPDGSQLRRPMVDAEAFRGSGGPIGDALNREGGQGTLAMINQNEMVLTPAQSQRLLRSGAANHVMHGVPNYMGGKLPNYMNGTNAPIPNYASGRIPNYMQGYAMSGGGNGDVISVSIPVTLNGDGEGGRQKADRLSRGFRAAVLGVIAQEKGAGGQLYS